MTEIEVSLKIFEMFVGGCVNELNFEDFVIIAKQSHAITGIVLYGNGADAVSILDSMKEPSE